MKEIEKIIQDAALIGDPHVNGRIARFDAMLPQLLKLVEGNIIEIGAGHGDSTKIFLKHARDFDRKVLVIDPFEDGWDNMPESYGKPYPYSVFAENTKQYEKELVLCRSQSYSRKSHDALDIYNPYSFAFVDGLQWLGGIFGDLLRMEYDNVKVICVDDIDRLTYDCRVKEAVEMFMSQTKKYKLITLPRQNIEGYLIRL